MDQNFQYRFPMKTWRLPWLMGLIFAVIVIFQHFELPYGNILLSISYAHKDLGAGNSSLLTDGVVSTVPALPPLNSSSNVTLPWNMKSNMMTHAIVGPNISALDKDATPSLANSGKSVELQNNFTSLHHTSSVITAHKKVISISDMDSLLLQSWSSPNSVRPRWSSAAERELLNARSQIENAPILKEDPMLFAPLYRNVSMFRRSYELMEETLKVYVYKEGEKPILHQPHLSGIYASEGWFMKLLEANQKFVTKNPRKAHLFYLPFSSRTLRNTVYVTISPHRSNLVQYLKSYLDIITAKYPFWNRTEGADHFLVACHDWAPSETKQIMANCIRSLCNSNAKRGFIFGKDVALPETNVRTPLDPLRNLGGKPPSQRSILAFFAGHMHGYLRPILLQHWKNKDPTMKIFGPEVRDKIDYIQHMQSSKYCICPRGSSVCSPRVVEAIFYECVPVIISDNYVLPFFEVLNWESFAVIVTEKDIPNLKNILLSIPEKKYLKMQKRVKRVQKHFLWHTKPVKYDIFHMILHSVWYARVLRM